MFQKIKKTVTSKIFLISFAIIASVGMITGSFVYKTKAATMGSHGLYIFGGMINDIELCCNGLKLEIGNPRSGTFMFTPGLSKLYMWYNISTDQCVLGDAYPFGVCIKPASWPPCSDEEEVDGTIRQMGTTLEGPMEGSCEDSGGGGGGEFGGGGATGDFGGTEGGGDTGGGGDGGGGGMTGAGGFDTGGGGDGGGGGMTGGGGFDTGGGQ